MKKLAMIGLIVPMVVLIAFASASLAEDGKAVLNQELNSDLNDGAEVGRDGDRTEVGSDTSLNDDSDLNMRNLDSSRGARAVGERRGRQVRRGQTATEIPEEQWGSWDDGDETNDEDMDDEDEDEDGDVTPTGN